MALIDDIRQLTDKQLLTELGYGRDGFQVGVYELYLEEAKKRNLDFSEESLKAASAENAAFEDATVARVYAALTIVFAGVFSFIPGLLLLRSKADGTPRYTAGYRLIGAMGIFLSIGIWFIVGVRVLCS